jgi:UDP-GlcNAc:undecaprenyl-phosphate GlcNAc-1-phosphate transferase
LNIGSMALVTSFGLGAWLAQLAERYGWCDRPGDALKIHRRPIPLVGGFGVVVGFGLVALSRAGSAVLAGVGIIALMVGAWDDFRWKARAVPGLKFGLQLGAAAAMLGLLQTAGVRFADAPAWVFWTLGFGFVVGSMNAFNLEDGMDGLAGGEAALSALGFAVLLARQGLSAPAFAAVALAGALIGFLVLNWHPARIFLGDGGSHLVGALLAGMALLTISRAGALVVLPVVLMLGLPVFDTVWIIALRLVSGRNPFAGDRGHIYDALYGANSSVPRTVLICWTIHLGLVLIGLALACLGT